jgi:hypothetical protein
MPEQAYIVTDRGGSRSYPILVTVDGPENGNLYLRAQEKAAQLSPRYRRLRDGSLGISIERCEGSKMVGHAGPSRCR